MGIARRFMALGPTVRVWLWFLCARLLLEVLNRAAVWQGGVARFEPPEERMAAETPEERMVRIRCAEIATYTEEQLAIDAAEHEHMGS